jgi:DNA repair protein RadC
MAWVGGVTGDGRFGTSRTAEAVVDLGPSAGAAALQRARAARADRRGPAAPGGRIREWPETDRPRERLLRRGAAALADGELLAILLGSGRGGETAVDVGRRLLGLCGEAGTAALARFGPEDLVAVSGVGPAKAAVVLAALELGRRAAAGAAPPAKRFRGPEDVARGLMLEMAPLDREQFRVLLLDAKHALIGTEVIAVGGLDHVPAEPREVFKPAVKRSAAAVILAHNHPSGDPEPSRQDVDLTTRLARAGQVLGVAVLDHLVIGRNCYVSLAARGALAAFGLQT